MISIFSIKQMKKLKDYDDYYSYLFKGFTYGINIRKIGNFDSIKQKIRNLWGIFLISLNSL